MLDNQQGLRRPLPGLPNRPSPGHPIDPSKRPNIFADIQDIPLDFIQTQWDQTAEELHASPELYRNYAETSAPLFKHRKSRSLNQLIERHRLLSFANAPRSLTKKALSAFMDKNKDNRISQEEWIIGSHLVDSHLEKKTSLSGNHQLDNEGLDKLIDLYLRDTLIHSGDGATWQGDTKDRFREKITNGTIRPSNFDILGLGKTGDENYTYTLRDRFDLLLEQYQETLPKTPGTIRDKLVNQWVYDVIHSGNIPETATSAHDSPTLTATYVTADSPCDVVINTHHWGLNPEDLTVYNDVEESKTHLSTCSDGKPCPEELLLARASFTTEQTHLQDKARTEMLAQPELWQSAIQTLNEFRYPAKKTTPKLETAIAAYKALADRIYFTDDITLNIVIEDPKKRKTAGYYSEKDKSITVVLSGNPSAEELMDTIHHELYHAYQHKLMKDEPGKPLSLSYEFESNYYFDFDNKNQAERLEQLEGEPYGLSTLNHYYRQQHLEDDAYKIAKSMLSVQNSLFPVKTKAKKH